MENAEPKTGEEKKLQSWWQSLPGMLTAVAGILTAVTGLILAISQMGPLWKSVPTGVAVFSGSPAISKGSVASVLFPLSEVRIVDSIGSSDRDLAYKVVNASLNRSLPARDMLEITFLIRVTNNGHGFVFTNARFFRLIADGDVVAPEGAAGLSLPDGSSGRATVNFYFPELTKNAQLQVGEIDQKTVRLPLSLKMAPK